LDASWILVKVTVLKLLLLIKRLNAFVANKAKQDEKKRQIIPRKMCSK